MDSKVKAHVLCSKLKLSKKNYLINLVKVFKNQDI